MLVHILVLMLENISMIYLQDAGLDDVVELNAHPGSILNATRLLSLEVFEREGLSK